MTKRMTSKSKEYVVRLNKIDEERKITAPTMCKMHFMKQPMKVSKANKQYLFDELGYEFLDCCGNIAHVGHCHPHVVHSGQRQMETLSTAQGFVTEVQNKYGKALVETVDDPRLNTVLLVNSGSEAVELAIRLAQAYTKRKHIINHQPAVHGHTDMLTNMHYKFIKQDDFKRTPTVHHLPVCDTYRGPFAASNNPVKDAVASLRELLNNLKNHNQSVCGILTETMHTAAGNILPPEGYLQEVAQTVREFGGLIILDEVLTGLGRHGSKWWSFQHTKVVPDILIAGRSLGNGQPIAAVITSQIIVNSMSEYSNSFGGNPVSCSMGLAVLEVIRNEHLLTSASLVGKDLMSRLKVLEAKHPNIGQVRGAGLSLVIDIVTDKDSRKPDKEFAEKLTYRLREQYRTLIPADGPEGNCLFITPPMCFSLENSQTLVKHIDNAINDVVNGKRATVKSLFELSEEFELTPSGSKRKGDLLDATGKQGRFEPAWNEGID